MKNNIAHASASFRLGLILLVPLIGVGTNHTAGQSPRIAHVIHEDILPVETLAGDGVWVDPVLANVRGTTSVTVWFDRQFLGDGKAFLRRSQEFSGQGRKALSQRVIETLKTISEQSYQAAQQPMRQLVDDQAVNNLQWHWIVNGFSCTVNAQGIEALKNVPGVKKIFQSRPTGNRRVVNQLKPEFFPETETEPFAPDRYKHPWYSHYLLADKTWQQLGVSGEGSLNVVMDGNFVFPPHVAQNLYRNPDEIPGNEIDDDGNGLIDDYHGYNFARGDAVLTTVPVRSNANVGLLHGFICVAEICGAGTKASPYEFGIAPSAKWAGLISGSAPEPAIEWAIEHGADTFSMSFSIPNLGELRSHWRKMLEQATFCGLCSVSGAGNFAQQGSRTYAPIPVQMRIPEDIPLAVFAPAGVQRTFERTPFSSQGPVKWETEHYQDGMVDKPDFCAFNMGLPRLMLDGTTRDADANGNSFAGPMMAGTLSLMFSADPDLLPWDAREILIETATDVGAEGFDHQTGHGLINCYRAVREVLRRKCIRDGEDPKPYEGRSPDDELDLESLQKTLQRKVVVTMAIVQPGSAAAKAGLKRGDQLKSLAGQVIESQQDLATAMARANGAKDRKVIFEILRDGKEMASKVEIPENGQPGIRFRVDQTLDAPVFQ